MPSCISGMMSYSSGTTSTRSLIRLASPAVISTASKHLHNDLAKAIKALEQKKKGLCMSPGIQYHPVKE